MRRPTRSWVPPLWFAVGIVLILTSNRVKTFLILHVGPERALGKGFVHRLDDGTVLMTNPVAMFLWMLPCLVPAAVCLWLAWRGPRGGR